jgi:hypothetical protein
MSSKTTEKTSLRGMSVNQVRLKPANQFAYFQEGAHFCRRPNLSPQMRQDMNRNVPTAARFAEKAFFSGGHGDLEILLHFGS